VSTNFPTARRAFTLIELLVVVAIIAILAAIAIPNLLEAQVRSKVSRAKSDLRAIVTSVESYVVDWNQYPTYHYYNNNPLFFYMGGIVQDFGLSPPYTGASPITTPISYMSSVPQDPFSAAEPGFAEYTRQYHFVNWPYGIAAVSDPARKVSFGEAYEDYGPYRLHSRGPDGLGPDKLLYDPTNGTTSAGDVRYSPRTNFDKATF